MNIFIGDTIDIMARQSASLAAESIHDAITERGEARIIVATGASQFGFLEKLTSSPGIDWSKVTAFHLDEYIGLTVEHRASFRLYLRQRLLDALPSPLKAFHEVNGDAADPDAECRRLGDLINSAPIDVACVGIGENGHLAFNDPPADFDTEEAYLIVRLDEECRRQQVGEGWFGSLDEVPEEALTMSVPQILKSRRIICTVPDERKAAAVLKTVKGAVSASCPASALRNHPDCTLFVDHASAALLI